MPQNKNSGTDIKPEDWSVLDHFVKTEAAPQVSQQPEVRSDEWVEELAQNWERKLLELTISRTDYGDGLYDAYRECLKQLRAHTESSSTHRI